MHLTTPNNFLAKSKRNKNYDSFLSCTKDPEEELFKN